jgi:hypothetical protein
MGDSNIGEVILQHRNPLRSGLRSRTGQGAQLRLRIVRVRFFGMLHDRCAVRSDQLVNTAAMERSSKDVGRRM